MKTKKSRINIPMALACILLCCVMISFHFVSGLYARYSSSATGSASARVAKFNVVIDDAKYSENFQINFSTPVNSKLEIQNDSEVSVKCIVIIDNVTENMPLLAGTKYNNVENVSLYDYREEFIMDADTTIEKILVLRWEDEEVAVEHIMKNDLITVNVRVEQID